MIDFADLFKYLLRYKWLLIIVPVVAAGTTYFLTKDMPRQYRSRAQIGTDAGIAPQLILQNQQGNGIEEQRYRIIETMRMKRELDALSYRLLLHDLEQPDQTFRPYSNIVSSLTDIGKQQVIEELNKRLVSRRLLVPDTRDSLSLFDMIASMRYQGEVIGESLNIEPTEGIDYIQLEFTSENPQLSVFVVNTLATDFIYRYNSATVTGTQRSLELLDSVKRNKESKMNEQNARLANYKYATGVSSGGAQADIVYQQVMNYESRSAEVNREIASLRSAISRINNKLQSPPDQESGVSGSTNNEILMLENQLQLANQRYVDNGFRAQDKRIVDSLQQLRIAKVTAGGSRGSVGTSTSRQALVAERMRLETQLALAEGSVASIQNEIMKLRTRYTEMVPADAGIQNLIREADLATQEYVDALNRYNQATLVNTTGLRLDLIEPGLPGLPEPSKQKIYIGLSAIGSFSLCFAALVIGFLLDKRVFTPQQLKAATKSEVIGSLNAISQKNKDLRDIWSDNEGSTDYALYRDFIRSLRFEIDKEFQSSDSKVLGITSLRPGEGRTFVSSSLVYAFALIGKKVLYITDKAADLLSLISNKEHVKAQQFETFLVKKEIRAEDLITVLSKNTSNNSLLEIKDANSLIAGFEVLRKEFDMIIIDVESLQELNKAKEWLMFTDKSIGIISSGSVTDDQDHIRYLNQLDGFMGWVLNKVQVT